MSWRFGDFQLLLEWLTVRDAPFKRLNEALCYDRSGWFPRMSATVDGRADSDRKPLRHLALRKRNQRKGLEWVVTLQEVKQYLRIDFEDDDTLLLSLISTAKQLVMDVGRMDEERFSENEDVVRTAMLYTVSYLYENRNTADFSKLTLTLRAMLFAQREGVM